MLFIGKVVPDQEPGYHLLFGWFHAGTLPASSCIYPAVSVSAIFGQIM
jgi:hypothetical protein